MAFEKEYHEIVDILTDTKGSISNIDNPQIQPMIKRILFDLDRHIKSLSVQLRLPVAGELEAASKITHKPLTRFLGQEIEFIKPKQGIVMDEKLSFKNFEKVNQASADEVSLAELRMKRDELYPVFVDTDSAKLLDENEELVIKAVAKLVGLPVSDTIPKKVDIKFVEQVKEAIKVKQQELKDNEDNSK